MGILRGGDGRSVYFLSLIGDAFRKRRGGQRWPPEQRRAGGAALWGVPHKPCCKHRLPCSLHKYSIKRGWAADIPEIYCALWLRGILQMPNIFHVCGWKLRSRDARGRACVCKAQQKYTAHQKPGAAASCAWRRRRASRRRQPRGVRSLTASGRASNRRS